MLVGWLSAFRTPLVLSGTALMPTIQPLVRPYPSSKRSGSLAGWSGWQDVCGDPCLRVCLCWGGNVGQLVPNQDNPESVGHVSDGAFGGESGQAQNGRLLSGTWLLATVTGLPAERMARQIATAPASITGAVATKPVRREDSMNPVCTCGHLPAAGGEDVMGEQRTPAQQWAVRLRSDCQKPEFDIDGYFDHLHDLADAALSRAEEVNEARFAGEKALRGSILDLKDQIGALNQKIAALECRRFECDRHLRAHLDALESTMEQIDSPAKPALDPVILGLAMAFRATGQCEVNTRSFIRDAYREYTNERGAVREIAEKLYSYGLEGS